MTDTKTPPENEKVIFLAHLAHQLTVCARGTYEVGTENILQPRILRAYNELQHRVTASLRDHIGGVKGIPFDTIIEMVEQFGIQHDQTELAAWAIKTAYQHASKTKEAG